jgi:protoporphyrinogen oxidase
MLIFAGLLLAMRETQKIAIIGAGPGGLTAAYLLAKAGQQTVLFEKDPQYVGGISRTESYRGFLFDVGGHRFFSKSVEVGNFWNEILGKDMLVRPRSSRIYYNRKFYSYPLEAFDALKKLGLRESAICILSFLQGRLFPFPNPANFEQWVRNQFGKRAFSIFFKTYTEKVWGMSCREISADWAVQRIRGLSLGVAIKNSFFKNGKKDPQKTIKTLIGSFLYPRKGPGMMWEECSRKAQAMGALVKMNAEVRALRFQEGKWEIRLSDGSSMGEFDQVVSSAPLDHLVPALIPRPAACALQAASSLRYRDFIMVVLILRDRQAILDNWIYIHDPDIRMGRIQNFKSWSSEMVPDPSMVAYGLEYFCFAQDPIWNYPDEELIALGTRELELLGLVNREEIRDGYVIRQAKAYPVYDQGYKEHIGRIRSELKDYPGLQLIGRNGMHKYNNQDHSMMTAMLAVKNILSGKIEYDLWKVNEDAEYLETPGSPVGRMIPTPV